MDYQEFINSKGNKFIESGFEIYDRNLNKNLFDFQKFLVKKALMKGRYAIFAECGLGKTLMQLEWANQITLHTGQPVLILAPLAVVQQTIREGEKFGIECGTTSNYMIQISNYEQLDNIDCTIFSGIALDESGILKNYQGKIKSKILEKFSCTKFKTAWTATPSPNDHIELGNHAEFLNVCTSKEMVSQFFINDSFSKEKHISKYRLKKHSVKDFWNWVGEWASMIESPSDIGFDGSKYILPKLNMIEENVQVSKKDNGQLFNDVAVSATDFYKELSRSIDERAQRTADIVNSTDENFIVWIKSNEEEKVIKSLISDSKVVNGSDKPEYKAKILNDFAENKFRVLITKTKIAQFGLNYQNCHNQVFMSFDFSFESLYQAIRRSYRFGQKEQVNIHMITIETMGNVMQSINDKQEMFHDMRVNMCNLINNKGVKMKENKNNIFETENAKIINGDSCKLIKEIKSDSVDYTFFSPPFSDLYMFSDNPKDMSNCKNYNEFFEHFKFLIPELLRITKKGRLLSMHCTQMSTSKGKDGKLEIIDFRGDLIRAMQEFGWVFHAEVAIWKDPKIVAQRTKAMQLLHATTKRDSTINRMGFPDYLLTFKKEGDNENPVTHEGNGLDFSYWCKIAEPIWLEGEIDAGDVLKIKDAKAPQDEKHMTPTQREPIKRLLELYTNKGDLVFSPFSGVGTEGTVSIENNRRFLGFELKESYFELSKKYIEIAENNNKQLELF
jgi:DNA modification methylase